MMAKGPLIRPAGLIIGVLLLLSGAQPRDDFHVGNVDLSQVVNAASPVVAQTLEEARGRGESAGSAIVDALRAQQYPEDLWETLTDDFAAARAAEDWTQRTVSLAGRSGFVVPTDPNWREDPFKDPSWILQYHSLAWLQGAWQAGDRRAVADLVMDWITDNPASAAGPAWNDHAIAYRTDTLVKLLAEGLASELTRRELAQLLLVLHEQGVALRRFLDDPAWVGHNHNLFHSLSLFNLATAVPQLAHAEEWRARAQRRVGELLTEMVDPSEGVSTEQSVGYHFVALDLFATAQDWLRRHGAPLGPEVGPILDKMREFGALVTHPDGTLPAIGDTSYGAPFDGRHFDPSLDHPPVATWVLSNGRRGTAPPPLLVFPRTGYAIFRAWPQESADWADQTHLVARVGPTIRGHGHQDALSFVLYGGGGPVIIDPGGPYLYRWPERQHFLSVSAHNAVMVDGLDFGDDSGRGDVRIDGWGVSDNFLWLIAHHDKVPQVRVTRAFVLLSGRLLLLLDVMEPADSKSHLYTLGLHFPPDTVVHLGSDEVRVRPAEGRDVQVFRQGAGGQVEISLIEGAREPRLAGWVTPSPGRLEPAPLVQWNWSAVGTSASATVVSLATDQERVHGVTLAGEAQGGRVVTVETSRGRYALRINTGFAELLSQPR